MWCHVMRSWTRVVLMLMPLAQIYACLAPSKGISVAAQYPTEKKLKTSNNTNTVLRGLLCRNKVLVNLLRIPQETHNAKKYRKYLLYLL